MMLWACLLFPSLALDVFARALPPADAAKPFAIATGGRAPRIVGANAGARAAGILPGQLVSASLALAPDLVLRDRNPDAEAAALAAVATCATQFTPAVTLAPPDAVLVEIGGSLRLFGGLPKLTAQLSAGARDLGYEVQLALAPTPIAALLFARAGATAVRLGFSPGAAASKGAARKFEASRDFLDALAPLPLALTGADPAAIATLAAAGITTIGEACELPRASLARRVGTDFVAFLDRARGFATDPRPPFAPPPRYAGKIELPAPVENIEALAFAVNRLVHELSGWLTGRGLGAMELALALAHERYISEKTGVPATRVDFALAAPAREHAHLIAVLRERLARVALLAPVESIALTTLTTAPLASRNLGLLPGDEVVASVPLIDRLRARLGEDAVRLVAPHAEYRPERAWRESGEIRAEPAGSGRSALNSSAAAYPRPIWLLAEPEPLGHLLEAHPWVLRDGPERIESGWWDGTDVRRDYFIAENPRGETVWIYRDHRYGIDDGEWFLHGVFA
ncbi:MAG TPA: DNA polymerase Y family protein [Casimicrobiaceae bacterium]|nr:DNA polymerase Y family protein [Casimicrobiaceae bacterium]